MRQAGSTREMAREPRIQTSEYKRVQDIMKPLLLSMKLFGVYHDVDDVTSVSPLNKETFQMISKTKTKLCSWFSLSRMYCFTILVIMWANLIRYTVNVFPINEGITGRIIILVWFSLVALGDLVMFIACEYRSYLNTFYKQWNNIYQGAGCVATECSQNGLSRIVLIGTIAGWIWLVMNMLGLIFLTKWADSVFVESLVKPYPLSTTTYILLVVLHIFATAIYVFPIVFIVITCFIVRSSFLTLSHVIEKDIANAEEAVPLTLDTLRRIHLQMCRVVSVLDRSVRLLVAVEYAVNIPLACFLAYQLINVKGDIILVIINLFWLSLSIASIVTVTISCALVNEAVSGSDGAVPMSSTNRLARSPLEHVFEIQHKNATLDQSLQVTLFLSQLTSSSVGFTMMGMIILTKEVLLTLAGLYITYFFLLLQFRI